MWADQRLVQGNISYIALLPGQYLDIARERGQYLDIARERGQYLDIAREGGFQSVVLKCCYNHHFKYL